MKELSKTGEAVLVSMLNRDHAVDPENLLSVIDWGALGFTLHAEYGIIENYFLRISKPYAEGLRAANEAERAGIESGYHAALDGGDSWRAMDAADGLPWDVDIVDLKRLPDHVRARIPGKGMVLA
ncbi:MAG: hypothetical protein NT080_11605 [Spirochaetes bacterium]|nr:hypothetical protein [Spirochaetota bacterium]